MPNTNRASRVWWTLMVFLTVAAFFLLAGHGGHALGLLPYLLAFSCVFMHLLHRHGHAHGGSEEQRRNASGSSRRSR